MNKLLTLTGFAVILIAPFCANTQRQPTPPPPTAIVAEQKAVAMQNAVRRRLEQLEAQQVQAAQQKAVQRKIDAISASEPVNW
jgi:NADH dehydrogenase FAD-containing subunit